MTGTNGFCVKTFLRAAHHLAALLAAALGMTTCSFASDVLPINDFSAALSNKLPSVHPEGYQYADPPSGSSTERGLQFAEPRSASSPIGSGNLPKSAAWGHTDVQQAQYPLTDPAHDEEPYPPAPGTIAPHYVPPTIAPPTARSPRGVDNWTYKAQFQGDVTHVIGRGNTLGITSLTGRVVFEWPRLPGVSVRPHLGWHFLNGPRSTDLPAQLYDASVEARMYWPFREHLIGEFALAPSIFTDGDNTSGDALRLVGRGVAYYLWSDDIKLAAGATYLDRKDIQILPIAGVIWTPTPDHRLELLFPQPRIAHRYRKDAHHERWVYVSGELGGGSWAIQRTTGADDVVSYRDLRLITGIEWKYSDETSWRIEGGYVFGREVEYDSHIGDYDPGNTSMLRAAIVY